MAKVLLADDEVTMVQMITEVLRAEGHEVFPFSNGSAALESIEVVAPELPRAEPAGGSHCHHGVRYDRNGRGGHEKGRL